MTEQLKVDFKFNKKDFEEIENIEHAYFENDNISQAIECLKWYNKNNLTCIGVRNSNNKIIASVSILPLKDKVFKDIYEDKMNEADITHKQIEEYKDNHTYSIYLSSISISKGYINQYKVITTLLKGCIELFDLLVQRNIKIEKVMADASTIHGEKICKKLFEMNYIMDTNHESKIYCINGETFIKNMYKLKKFIK